MTEFVTGSFGAIAMIGTAIMTIISVPAVVGILTVDLVFLKKKRNQAFYYLLALTPVSLGAATVMIFLARHLIAMY